MSLHLTSTLRLTANELAALSRQGFVSREGRNGSTVYKLRFRVDGKQRVKSLGSNAELAQAVDQELAAQQRLRRQELEAKRWAVSANQLISSAKQQVSPVMRAKGFAFHGTSIRKSRNPLHKHHQPPLNIFLARNSMHESQNGNNISGPPNASSESVPTQLALNGSDVAQPGEPHYEARQAVIAACRDEALTQGSPTESILGCTFADLSQLEAAVMRFVDPHIRQPMSSQEFETFLPAIIALSRLSKQQLGFAKLRHHIERSRRKQEPNEGEALPVKPR